MPAHPASARRSAPAPDVPRLRLSSPDDVIAAVPYLLGFHPQRSLVVLGLAGPRGRLGVTMRMDLDPMPPGEMARRVVRALQQDADSEAILLVYDPEPEPLGTGGGTASSTSADRHALQPGEDVVAAVRAGLRRARIRVREALRVAEGRWWSYLCHDPSCCPSEGSPVRTADMPGGPSLVAATAVGAGLNALPDRAALAAGLEPPTPWSHEATRQAMARLADELAADGLDDPDRLADRLLERIAALRDRFAERRPSLGDDEVARVAFGLHLHTVRDTVITWSLDDEAGALTALLHEVVRRTPAPEHVPAATVLAWCSYLHGKGALAGVALELALDADPSYSLAQLVDTMLQNGIHPERLRRATRETRADLERRGTIEPAPVGGPGDTGPTDTGPTATGPTDTGSAYAGPANSRPAAVRPAGAQPADEPRNPVREDASGSDG